MWTGMNVWVTGASSGIGAALVRECSARGAHVAATARNEAALQAVATSCDGPVHVVAGDLSDRDELPRLVESVRSVLGSVDAAFLNAGVSQRAVATETDRAVTERLFSVNTLAPIEITRLLLPEMIEAGRGILVPVTSLAGKAGFPLRSTYCATKHALHGYFEAVRAETGPRGIQVTIAAPGFVQTNISKNAVRGDGSEYGRMDENQEGGISPAKCALAILRAVERGRLEVLPGLGLRGRLALFLHGVAPRLFARMIREVDAT